MTRFVFVAGKGGVGKTTISAARAAHLAAAGNDVVVVSTDPAHSLGDAFDVALSSTPTRIAVPKAKKGAQKNGRLRALHLDADAALARWLKEKRRALRLVAGRGTFFDDDDIDGFLDLSFPGVDEFVGLLELVRTADDLDPDVVVVDTAPTGHTLRLLEMPETLHNLAAVLDDMQGKHRVLQSALAGRATADAGDALVDVVRADAARLHALLRDPTRATFSWVTLPEPLSVAEAGDGVAALDDAGLVVDAVVVNRVNVDAAACAFCRAQQRAQRAVLHDVNEAFGDRALVVVPLQAGEPRGVAALLRLKETPFPRLPKRTKRALPQKPPRRSSTSSNVISLCAEPRKLVLVVGKGGVGKTSVAAAAALSSSQKTKTLLLSADPAHSVGDVLGVDVGDDVVDVDGLDVRELDAVAGFAATVDGYKDRVDDLFDALAGGSRFDAVYDRAVVRDLIELAPPGLDELLAILTVIEVLFEQRSHDVVVVDCAPTGHALRLLQMPALALQWVHAFLALLLKYKDVTGLGDVARDLLTTARQLKELIALLHDPARCAVVVVARPALLPVVETQRLLRALDDAGLPAPDVVVNGHSTGTCARCRRRRAAEDRSLDDLDVRGRRVVDVPLLPEPPVGADALRDWHRRWVEKSPEQ